MPATSARIVLVTAGDERQARSIARALVDERLAACVNILGPMRSVYRWRNAVNDEPEYQLIIKTRATLVSRLERRLNDLHSYEVPEMLALTPSAGSSAYLGWLLESTAPAVKRTAARRRSSSGKTARRG